jgi:hypothetical protein
MAITGADGADNTPQHGGGPPPPGNPPPPPPSNSGPSTGGSNGDPDHPTDGKPPDFDAIYAYAAMFIDLGDLIYEYAHNTIADGIQNVVWTGDRLSAAEAAKETLTPLTQLLASSDQHATVPSASRLLWNIGETINWFAINLEEQRAEERKHWIAELIGTLLGLFFMAVFGALAFLPATAAMMARVMSFLGDAIAAALESLWSGVEWLGTLGRGFGDAVVGAALSVGPQLASTAISDAAAHLKIEFTPKDIIIGTLTGAAGGVIFGSDIRAAAAAAAAAKAAAKAAGGAEFGVGALPKPTPHALPGGGTKTEAGGLPSLGGIRANELPGVNGVKVPNVGAEAPKFAVDNFNGTKGLLKFDHQTEAIAGSADKLNPGGPAPEGGFRSTGGVGRDGGAGRVDIGELPPAGTGLDGSHPSQHPDEVQALQARLDTLRPRPDTGPGAHPATDHAADARPVTGERLVGGDTRAGDHTVDTPPATGERLVGGATPGERPTGNAGKPIDERFQALRSGNDDATSASISRYTSEVRLAHLEQQITEARAEMPPSLASRPGDAPPVSRTGNGPSVARAGDPPPVSRGGAGQTPPAGAEPHDKLAARLPDSPANEPTTLGAEHLDAGLIRARSEAASAGVPPRYIKALTENVQTALDHGRLNDAAVHLAKMRDQVDRFQVGRRLDSFREHVDAGPQRAAELGMDKVTWLEKAATIEKAAADGRFNDVHTLLKDYEKTAGDNLRALRAQDKPPADAEPAGRTDSASDDIDRLADRLAALRSDRIDGAGLSQSAQHKLSAKAAELDRALRGEDKPADTVLGKIGEKIYPQEYRDEAKLADYQKAAAKAGYQAEVRALRNGDSPLPKEELARWQKSLDDFKGWKYHEQKLMEHYEARLTEYRADTQAKIAGAAFAPDQSVSLNSRLDAQLSQISKELRDRTAAEHLGAADHGGIEGRDPDDNPDLTLPSVPDRSETSTPIEPDSASVSDSSHTSHRSESSDGRRPDSTTADPEHDDEVLALQARLDLLKRPHTTEAVSVKDGPEPSEDDYQARLDALRDDDGEGLMQARWKAMKAEHYPRAESIDRVDANTRLTTIREQLKEARDEAAARPDEGPSADHETEELQSRLDAMRRADDSGNDPRLPSAPSDKPTAYGSKDLEWGLTRARNDAKSAGLGNDDIAALAGDVRAALDEGRVGDAAKSLEKMRTDIDRFQIARRLDHFRDLMDAGHQRAAEAGMDRVTWLEHGEAVESAAANGRFDDLHVNLNKFERDLGQHLQTAKMMDQHVPGGAETAKTAQDVDTMSFDDALQARLDGLRGSDRRSVEVEAAPSEDALQARLDRLRGSDRPSVEAVEAALKEGKTPPRSGEEKEIDDLIDRHHQLRLDDIANAKLSEFDRLELEIRWEKTHQAVGSGNENAAAVDDFHQAWDHAELKGKIQALRDGDSSLPSSEVKNWQRQLEEFKDEPTNVRGVMARYDDRVSQYHSEVQNRIANSSYAPDRSKPLTQRLDDRLGQLSKDLRTKNAAENLNLADRLPEVPGAGDRPPPGDGDGAPSGTGAVSEDDLEARLSALRKMPDGPATTAAEEAQRPPSRPGEGVTAAQKPPTERPAASPGEIRGLGRQEPVTATPDEAQGAPAQPGETVATMQKPAAERPAERPAESLGEVRDFSPDQPVGSPPPGRDVVKALLDARTEPGAADWLYSQDGMSGWRATGKSWSQVRISAGLAGRGGLAVFSPKGEDARLVHHGEDGELRVVEVGADGRHTTFAFDEYSNTHDAPVSVVAVTSDGLVLGRGGRSADPVAYPEPGRLADAAAPQDITDLAGQVAERAPAGEQQVFEVVVDARTEPGTAEWLWSDDGILAWRPTSGSWSEVRTSAGRAGRGGLAVFPPEAGGVRFVHHGEDGGLRVVEMGVGGEHEVFEFDDYARTQAAPVTVVAVTSAGVVLGRGGRSPEPAVKPATGPEAARLDDPATPADIAALVDQVAQRGPGQDVFQTVLDTWVRKGAAEWLSSDEAILAWRPTSGSWSEVRTSAGRAGRGGLAVFPPEAGGVRFVHHGEDGGLRVVEVDDGGQHAIFDFDGYVTSHAAPVTVVVVPNRRAERPEPAREVAGVDDSVALRQIADVVGQVAERAPVDGRDVFRALVDSRFEDGAAEWLSSDEAVLAWRPTSGSWSEVRTSAGRAGRGGLAVFPPEAGGVRFVHHGEDGELRVVEVSPDGVHTVTGFDEYATTHQAPVTVVTIGRDGGGAVRPRATEKPAPAVRRVDDATALQDTADVAAEVAERMPLPGDVQLISDLTAFAVEDGPRSGAELLRSIFDQRFALGVRLKGATGTAVGARTGSDWLFTGRAGWQATRTWGDVEIAAGLAGAGGLTLFAPADGQDVAIFVHNGRDGIPRVIEVDLHGNRHVTPLEQYRQSHPVPDSVASIDHCAEVHL